jgi:hypothetical protein
MDASRATGGSPARSEDPPPTFSVAVSMRGRAAHLAVKGRVDSEAVHTLEHLVERLPQADVTEIVIDLTEDAADADRRVAAAVAAATTTVEVSIVGATETVS